MTEQPRPRRRAVLVGAAWMTPVVLATTASPAYAVSPCDGFTFPAMPTSGTSGNGWTRTSNSNISGTGDNNFIAGPGYSLTADPTSILASSVITIQVPVTLAASTSYKFSWTYSKYGGNPRQLTCDLIVNGAAQTGGLMDSDVGADYTTLSRSVTFTSTTAGVYQIGYRFTLPVPLVVLSTVGDDMQVYSPTVTCLR